MREVLVNLFEPEFNRSIKVQSTDQRLTSNAGVILLREADHRLGKQRGAKYTGYYRKTVYHPLVASLSVGGDYDGNRQGHRTT